MSAPDNASGSPSTGENEKPTVAELQADIEQTREQLGETVDALAAKLDVKSRAKDKVSATKEQLKERVDVARTQASDLAGKGRAAATTDDGKPTPVVLAGAAALAVAVVVAVVLVGRRSR